MLQNHFAVQFSACQWAYVFITYLCVSRSQSCYLLKLWCDSFLILHVLIIIFSLQVSGNHGCYQRRFCALLAQHCTRRFLYRDIHRLWRLPVQFPNSSEGTVQCDLWNNIALLPNLNIKDQMFLVFTTKSPMNVTKQAIRCSEDEFQRLLVILSGRDEWQS